MKRTIYFLVTLGILFPLSMQAQKEMNWWYFGANAGLNFNETQMVTSTLGVSTALPKSVSGPLNTMEGCLTLSDSRGNLLMSSDGRSVYNKKNEGMLNGGGLWGGNSSTQSGIVVPAPNNPNKFYLVTVAQERGFRGVRYSVVNINVEDPNDMGYVESDTKNSILKDGASYENIAAVAHSNGSDYWLLHRTATTFYVWLLTDQGFSVTPHTYETPPLVQTPYNYVGELIMSVDNSKVVSFTHDGGEIISANFDISTGVISEIQVAVVPEKGEVYGSGDIYGGSFSPNAEYLYYTGTYGSGVCYKIKYSDLRAGNILFRTDLGVPLRNVATAYDKRLYGISYSSKDLYVFMDPDEGATDIRKFSNYLLGTTYQGLPNFGASFFSAVFKAKPFTCAGYESKLAVTVAVNGVNIPTKLVWDFGDGSQTTEQEFMTGIANYKMKHSFANSGSFRVTVTPYQGTNALSPSFFETDIIDCSIKTNRMIRHELLNKNELEIKK